MNERTGNQSLSALRAELDELRERLDGAELSGARRRRIGRRGKLLVTVAAATVLGAGTFGAAYASIPSADNTVTACVTSGTGATRIIDTDKGETCLSTETKAQWGGGMRYRGVWSKVRSDLYSTVRKGDVMYYDGAPNAFGCTSPKGAWVNVAGSYAYPCLEFPQNWAPLALDGKDGPAGKNADVHWADFNSAHQLTGSSDANTYIYTSAYYVLVQFPGVDLSKCDLQATVGTVNTQGMSVGVQNYYGYVYVSAQTAAGSAKDVPFNVMISCVHY